jgi:RND family efflux transporter MFP subunit
MKVHSLAFHATALLAMVACGQPRTPSKPEVTSVPSAASEAPGEQPKNESDRIVAVVAAKHTASVTAQVEGTLLSVDVRLGDAVEAGDRLATIDNRPLKEAVSAAAAVWEMRRAEANMAVLGSRHATEELEREGRLHSEGLVTGRSHATARSASEQAEAKVKQAQAAAKEAGALFAQAQRSLEQSVVSAPVAGIVASRFVDPGNEVRLGEPIVRLVAPGTPWIRFGVPTHLRDRISVGDEVTFTSVDGKQEFQVTVSHLAPDVDPLSELVLGEASLTREPSAEVYPGLGGYVTPETSSRPP